MGFVLPRERGPGGASCVCPVLLCLWPSQKQPPRMWRIHMVELAEGLRSWSEFRVLTGALLVTSERARPWN